MFNPFQKLVLVYILWNASSLISGGMFEVYFFGLGMSQSQIYLADTIWFLPSLLAIPLFASFSSKKFMAGGIMLALIATLAMAFSPGPAGAFTFRILLGLTNFLFWVPFNVLYYEYSRDNNASLGALYYSLGPLLSLFLPASAGILAQAVGFQPLFILAAISFALTLVASILLVEDKVFKYTAKGALDSLSGLKTLVFLEGFSGMSILSVTLPVMLLTFAQRPLDFGLFLSASTVFSVGASLVTARYSDKLKSRRVFILPAVIAFAAAAILAAVSQDIGTFFIAFGLVNFLSRIFFPLSLALVVDNSKSLADSITGREIFLNAGRLLGCLAGFALAAAAGLGYSLLFQGAAMLLYAVVFEANKHKLSSH